MTLRLHLRSMLLAGVIAAPASPSAQTPRAPAGQPVYAPATVVTVQGEIAGIERVPRGRGHEGVHLLLATETETLDVHLGPDWYVDEQGLKPSKGERVEVKGSRITLGGKPALIAQEVRSGDARMVLRDASGVPVWARGPRR